MCLEVQSDSVLVNRKQLPLRFFVCSASGLECSSCRVMRAVCGPFNERCRSGPKTALAARSPAEPPAPLGEIRQVSSNKLQPHVSFARYLWPIL
ncbi:unnamed protein product [Colias eurytheme]|nr:unnamed protein product [Colias eurytheme]